MIEVDSEDILLEICFKITRPVHGTPKVEQLTRMYLVNLHISAVIENSETRNLHQHFDPCERAVPAFITIRGASIFYT